MKYLFFALFVFSSMAHAQTGHPIKTTDGTFVSAASLVTTYKGFGEKNKDLNVFVQNRDGSVTIVKPRVGVQGKLLGLGWTLLLNDPMIEGACKFYDLGEPVSFVPAPSQHVGEVAAIFNEDGTLEGTSPHYYLLFSLTCKSSAQN